MIQSNLDRFSRPGPSEKYTLLRVVSSVPECEVCGQSGDSRFLKTWNEKQVCTKCIAENTQDYNF